MSKQIRTLFVFLILLVVMFIAASLLAVPLHALLKNFIDIPFDKLIQHACSLSGLAFVFLYLKFNNILNRRVAGYATNYNSVSRDILLGFSAGTGIILVLAGAVYVLGIHQAKPGLNLSFVFLCVLFVKAIVPGMAVGLLEETMYRGALLGGLRAKTGTITAVITSSLIYSAVHFINFPDLAPDSEVKWHTGLELLSGAFTYFSDPANIDKFLALFVFGVLLALVRIKNGNIFLCIGIHAGVVFAIKFFRKLTDYNPDNGYTFLINPYDQLLGYLAFGWLLILVFIYASRSYRRSAITPHH